MNKRTSRSEAKLKIGTNIKNETKLPSLTGRNNSVAQLLPNKRRSQNILSSPFIERSRKNITLMKKINPLNKSVDSEDEEEDMKVLKRLQSGKQQKVLPELTVVTKNADKKTFLKQPLVSQSLVGEDAVKKFYQRYKELQRVNQKQTFFNEKNIMTSINNLLQMHNFTPRKLTLVKMKGQEAILDLKKLGIGQGSMGPVVSQIVSYLSHFQEIDFSYNCIGGTMAQTIVGEVGRAKKVNLSHNRIGKIGCQKFMQLFLSSTTRIEELNLEENNLLDAAGAILVEQLLKYNNLKMLNLNKNFMGLKFSQQMKRILKGGDKNMLELYLSWNQFTSKAVNNIFQGVADHPYLRVFDFSWNKISQENISPLLVVFEEATNLVHADFSFCELKRQSIEKLAATLKKNHTLYGVHFQGNSGYIDHKGFLNQTQLQFSQYPLPIIKGIIRRINGVRPHPTNQFRGSSTRDVCWICHSWQQKYFSLPYTEQMKDKVKELESNVFQCYIHLKHQNFRAVKMALNKEQNLYEIERMCPIGNSQFFFTFSPAPAKRISLVSHQFQVVTGQITISFSIGSLNFTDKIKERNKWNLNYVMDPIDQNFDPEIDLVPRTPDNEVIFKQSEKIKKKRKVVKEQKVNVQLKDLDGEEDNQFLQDKSGNRQNQNDYLLKCIEFDIENSKIARVIKEESILNQFKFMMLNYYKYFKDTFYYLSRGNPTLNGIFSIPESQFTGFLEEQKYITKRVTLPKIMLKFYASLSAGDQEVTTKTMEGMASMAAKKDQKNPGKLFSRPQFLQFLIRLALQKWCLFKPKKKKPEVDKQKLLEEEEKKLLNAKKGKLNKSPKKGRLSKEQSKVDKQKEPQQPEVPPQNEEHATVQVEQKEEVAPEQEDQQNQEEDGQNKKKIKLPLPILEGIQKTMKTVIKYGQNYSSGNWRRKKYLRAEILIVLKAYQQFLSSLYFKYSSSKYKTSKPKKLFNLLTLDELKTIFLDTDIRKTKEAMKEVEMAFLDSKRLSVEDGNLQYGLNFQQFQECIARISQFIWFNPIASSNATTWQNEMNRKNTPLFLRLESLITALYWRTPELHNRRMAKIVEKGIFELQSKLIIERVEAITANSGALGLYRRNSMMGEEEQVNLKQIIAELRWEFDHKVIKQQVQEEYEEEIIV